MKQQRNLINRNINQENRNIPKKYQSLLLNDHRTKSLQKGKKMIVSNNQTKQSLTMCAHNGKPKAELN